MFKSAVAFYNPPVDPAILHKLQEAFPAGDPLPSQPQCVGISGVEEVTGSMTLVTIKTVKRVVPASVVKRELAAKVEKFADSFGYAPGKKMKIELKEQVIEELLPKAFLSESLTRVLFTSHFIIFEKQVDNTYRFLRDALQRLVEATDDDMFLGLSSCDFLDPQAIDNFDRPVEQQFNYWLTTETPDGLTIGDRASVKGQDSRVDFRTSEILVEVPKSLNPDRHIQSLEMLIDKTRFKVSERLALSGIRYPKAWGKNADDGYTYLVAHELVRIFNQLIEVLK